MKLHQIIEELPQLNLPTDRPRTKTRTDRSATYTFRLERELSNSLKILAVAEEISLFALLLGAFQTLLYRLSGQEEIFVFSAIAEPTLQLEGSATFATNSLDREQNSLQSAPDLLTPTFHTKDVRVDFAGNPTFLSFLRSSERSNDAVEALRKPFNRIPEHQGSPQSSVMFVWQPPQARETVRFEELFLDRATLEQFDLTSIVVEELETLAISISYNRELFDETTIERMARHFQTLLRAIASHPQERVDFLPLLTEAERHQLLVEWNQTQTDYPQDKCIHELFEEQVRQTPHSIAVVFEGEQLTYEQLNLRAAQLARHLQSLGVAPDVPVGVCVERSIEMVVGLLAILKAGGAYVPLDPAYPIERLTYAIADSQISVLLSQQHLVRRLPQLEAQIVCLDSDWETIAPPNLKNSTERVAPHNLAYIIYTSGSTGKPKGVPIAHRGLCNLALAQIDSFKVEPESRVLQFASFSFDASVSEIFMALCVGAQLYLAPAATLQPGPNLIALLQQEQITHVTLPPSVLATLSSQEFPALQSAIVAGEACPQDLARKWSRGRRFFNAYGPTEATVCATIGPYTDADGQPPIGRPIANTQIYILDRHLQPVPIGVPGELHIRSVGLTRGYLNRPELNAEKFIPNPFDKSQPEDRTHPDRLYKTGDLARYLPDGNIEYLGRIDRQVKIRGFRIELPEIEAVLLQHPDVREAIVLPREDIPGHKRLVAYVVSDDIPPTRRELEGFLKAQLPDYMVPSGFVFLDAMPLTPNGKIDRRALPELAGWRPELDTAYVSPQTETEKEIAQIWQRNLGIDRVGIGDNFFELGGTSLLVVQVHRQLCERLQQPLEIVTLFKYPTVQTLARHLSQTSQAQPESPSTQQRARLRRNRQSTLDQRQRRRSHRLKQQNG